MNHQTQVLVDGAEAVTWTTGEADVLLTHQGHVVHRLEADADDARRLVEWLHEAGFCTVADALGVVAAGTGGRR